MISLRSSELTVKIQARGAALTSLRAPDGPEFLYQADSPYWGRQAPVLFPIVGRLRDDSYKWEGAHYSLSQHGFARDRQFSLLQQSENQAVFSLSDDPSSRSNYPFPFYFEIVYSLAGNALQISYRVQNPGEKKLYFSVGGHPAFRWPVYESESALDYEIVFSERETAAVHRLREGLFSGKTDAFLQAQDRFALRPELFEADALVFKRLNSDWVALRSRTSGAEVRLDFAGWPYLGIWTKPGAPFVCLEPWQGLADRTDSSGNLAEKEGIVELAKGGTWERSYTIRCTA